MKAFRQRGPTQTLAGPSVQAGPARGPVPGSAVFLCLNICLFERQSGGDRFLACCFTLQMPAPGWLSMDARTSTAWVSCVGGKAQILEPSLLESWIAEQCCAMGYRPCEQQLSALCQPWPRLSVEGHRWNSVLVKHLSCIQGNG